MSEGRKFGSVEVRIGSSSVPAKPAPSSRELDLANALEADHVGHQQLPCISGGKCRLDRISMPGQGRMPLVL